MPTKAASIPHVKTPKLLFSVRLQIPTPQRLTDRTHPARHPTMLHIPRQRLLQRTLRHARIIQITETAPHTRRPITPLARRPIVPCRALILARRKSQLGCPSGRQRTVRGTGCVRCRGPGGSGGVGAAGGGVQRCGFDGYGGCDCGGGTGLLGEAKGGGWIYGRVMYW